MLPKSSWLVKKSRCLLLLFPPPPVRNTVLKTFQKEMGGDPIFLKIKSKSLAEAKLTNRKKPRSLSYRTTIQTEWNRVGRRKPQRWEKIVTSNTYTPSPCLLMPDALMRDTEKATEWERIGELGRGCFWGGRHGAWSSRLQGQPPWLWTPPQSSCKDFHSPSWAFTLSPMRWEYGELLPHQVVVKVKWKKYILSEIIWESLWWST